MTASPPDLLVLHLLRLTGVTDDAEVAARTGLDRPVVSEMLLDHQAWGRVTHVEFAGSGGWALTDRGRAEDERRLNAELTDTGTRPMVEEQHRAFESLNPRLVRACTDWQMRPTAGARFAVNDHANPAWDARVLDELSALGGELRPLAGALSRALARFAGYDERFSSALAQARAGDPRWVAGVGVASCHAVWMELHEDLLSTLGIQRGPGAERG